MQKIKRILRQERKKLVIKAAIKVFAKKGFQGTKTKDLAKAAGISEAMIYKIFKNKDDLYSAIISKNVQDHSNEINDLLSDFSRFPAVLKETVLHVIEKFEKDPAFLRLMLFSALEEHKFAQNFAESHLFSQTEAFAKVIENGIKAGEFHDINPKLAAHIFQSLIGGYCIMQAVLHINISEPIDKQIIAETMVDIFLNGLRKHD